MNADYIYTRKDGGTTHCYGTVKEDSNFSLVFNDEYKDCIITDYEGPRTWHSVCKAIEEGGRTDCEQIEEC